MRHVSKPLLSPREEDGLKQSWPRLLLLLPKALQRGATGVEIVVFDHDGACLTDNHVTGDGVVDEYT